MNKKLKWGLIISGYIVVFVLTFIVMGGLAALLNFIEDVNSLSREFINQLIEIIPTD